MSEMAALPDAIVQERPLSKARLKILFIGDAGVGKTALLLAFQKEQFSEDVIPQGIMISQTDFFNYFSVFELSTTEVKLGKKKVYLDLWDSEGNIEFENIRSLSYPGADVVVICYSCNNLSSFENIKSVWYPEFQKYAKGSPSFFLVGTKNDLNSEVSLDLAHNLRRELGALDSLQCSAKNHVLTKGATGDVQNVFMSVVKAGLKARKKRKTLGSYFCCSF